MSSTLYLVGCGKSKCPEASPARSLYTGALVRKALAYAEQEAAASGGTILILSALHGVVELDHVLDPYDLSMGDLSAAERRAWGDRAAATIARQADLATARLVVLAGRAYADPLRPHAARADGTSAIEEPMAGLGLGQRLRWLNHQTAGSGQAPC